MRDADRIIGLVEAEEKGPAKLIINRIKADMVRRGDMLSTEDVMELLAVDLLGVVPEDEKVLMGGNRGAPVALEERSQAGQAFRNIARRLRGENIPFLDLMNQNGLLHRLSRFLRQGGN